MKSLFLYEEIMLLALRDEEGTFSGGFVELAVAGAVMAELLLENHVYVAEPRRKLIDHNDPPPTGDPIIDECLEKITSAKRRAALSNWVPRLSRIPKLRKKVAQRLCERGIVKSDEDKVLFVFPRTIYPEIDPEPEEEIMSRIKSAIFGNDTDLDPRTVILISLAHRTDLLRHNLDDKELRKHKKRIEQIIEGEAMGKAARDIIDAFDSAATVTALIPALIATTAGS
ncbi:MAG: GPP34 family phosphoprotein [Verrucomicrobiales bacterium]|nr:GPP34 family phosphoprotein [Verrucomicrobiales bacterium]